ncbi:hypothetical protein Emag_004215 [Eimeria magna]
MGPRTLRATVGMSLLLFGASWDSSATAAPWNGSSSSGSSGSGSSSLEAILHNAGLEVPPTQSLSAPPEPAHNALDLFSVGAWLGAPLGLASQPLANYPSEMNRRLRPQAQGDLPGIDRSQQWLASLPGLGLMSSTAQLQRQQPYQEKELAAAASRLANSVKTVRLTLTPSQRKAVENMVYALQTIRIESNRSVLGDYDRAMINQLTATASKSVEEVERFLNSYSELLTRLGALGKTLQSLSPPWEYTPSAPLAVAAAELHAAAADAAAAVDADQEQPHPASSSSSTTTTTTITPTATPDAEGAPGSSTAAAAAAAADATNTEQAAPAATAEESQETVFSNPPTQPAVRSTAATTSARGGRQRNRRPSNATESSSSSSSSTSTSTAAPIDADEQEDEQQLQEQQLQEQQLVKEVQHQLQEQQLQEQQLQQLQLQMQMQQQLQEQQQMQLQLQEQLHEQQQLQELQQLQQQFEEEENWRKVQQQRLQQMLASEEAAAMARLRALLRSTTYADLRAAVGPYGPPVSLREAMAFKEFGDKLKVKGWGAGEIRRAARKTSSTTEAFYAVAREVGLSKASVDALAPRMPTLLK